jgi:hypothetical protein
VREALRREKAGGGASVRVTVSAGICACGCDGDLSDSTATKKTLSLPRLLLLLVFWFCFFYLSILFLFFDLGMVVVVRFDLYGRGGYGGGLNIMVFRLMEMMSERFFVLLVFYFSVSVFCSCFMDYGLCRKKMVVVGRDDGLWRRSSCTSLQG